MSFKSKLLGAGGVFLGGAVAAPVVDLFTMYHMSIEEGGLMGLVAAGAFIIGSKFGGKSAGQAAIEGAKAAGQPNNLWTNERFKKTVRRLS